MQMLIYLIIGLVIGYLIGRSSASRVSRTKIINPHQIKEKQEHLLKVLELVMQKGEVANDDVENALGVSNATAERYLQELEDQGKIQQIGTRGKYVIYKAI